MENTYKYRMYEDAPETFKCRRGEACFCCVPNAVVQPIRPEKSLWFFNFGFAAPWPKASEQ